MTTLCAPFASALTVERTIYANPSTGLTVSAWAYATLNGEWIVRFRRRIGQRVYLDQNCSWSPRRDGGWSRWLWHPVGNHLVSSSALAAVEEWLAKQAVAPVAPKYTPNEAP